MSFIYSQALVAAFSEANYSDTDASALLNGNLTPRPCLWHDKTMEPSRLSRFGMMCEPLTEGRGAELLTWFVAVFLARTSVQPEKVPESPESAADYGEKWHGSLTKYDPDSSSWKTAQCLLDGGLELFSETWPRWGLMRNGECWGLTILEDFTSEKEYGYWPTPVKTDGFIGISLATLERKEKGETRPSGAKIGSSLKWHRKCVENWTMGSKIVPTVHELLMIWPIGHTDLQPLETDKYQSWLQQHGECLVANESNQNQAQGVTA